MTTTPAPIDYTARFRADRLHWVAPIRATDFDPRAHLRSILVEPAPGGGVYIVATNGPLLLCAYDANGRASQRFTFSAPLPSLLKMCGPCYYDTLADTTFENDDGHATHVSIADGHLTLLAGAYDGTADDDTRLYPLISQPIETGAFFPKNWQSMLTPGTPVTSNTVPFNADFLKQALAFHIDDYRTVTLSVHEAPGTDPDCTPILIGFHRIPLRGVLMPVSKKHGEVPHPMPFDPA